MMNIHNKQRDAFTLIELSIVIVIIALITAGILIGSDMIASARARAEVGQMESVISATKTFVSKYNCLPGDCSNATAFFPSAVNGNGDGRIINPPWPIGETFQFWYQLSQAGLIPGNYDGSGFDAAPAGIINNNARYLAFYLPSSWYVNNLGGSPGVSQYDMLARNFAGAGNVLAINRLAYCGTIKGGFNAPQAYAVDSKIDDGKPFTGKITQFDPWTGGGACAYWGGCVVNATQPDTNYLLTDTVADRCTIIYLNVF